VRRSILFGLLVLVLTPGIVPAQARTTTPFELARLGGDVVLDGRPDEAAWSAVPALPLTMYAPIHRGTPTEATEIRLAYDADHLYAAGRFLDSEPGGIRVNSLHRDRWSGDDVFALFVDSFNDNQSARRFSVTPAGTRIDELIGADGQERNLSWDAPWDVATARDERGWYFELRIPFASLRFQGSGEEVVMGITASRLVARKNERTTWPDISPRSAFDRPSETQDVVLRGIRSARPALLTPYALGGMSRLPAGPSRGPTESLGEVGADLKYSLNDNLFLDLSVNTDFAQVEADDQQINLTSYPLFFPEKRQFFQERSDLFLFDFAQGGRLFHSRRIGLSDDATPVRILGGARLAGRTGGWDIGLLDMQSDRHGDQPGENFGVARVRRRVLNPYSYAGGMVTSRLDTEGEHRLALGADAVVRLPGDHLATARWGVTSSTAAAEPGSVADRSQLYLEWTRRAARGLTYWLRMNRIGAEFAPAVGFLPRRDATHYSLYTVYNTTGREGDLLRSFGPGVIINSWYGNGDGELETLYAGHWWNYELWNGVNGFLQFTHRMDGLGGPLTIGDGVVVPAGEHRSNNLWFYVATPPGDRLRTILSARVGGFYDGRQVELLLRPVWNVSRHLELGADLENTSLRFAGRGQGVDVRVARLRVRAAANARLSAAALVQYNSLARAIGINLRLRYNVREGTDAWLVWDEGLNTERSVDGTPDILPLSSSRAVRAKVTYTFGL
jgi:hypothetical protein